MHRCATDIQKLKIPLTTPNSGRLHCIFIGLYCSTIGQQNTARIFTFEQRCQNWDNEDTFRYSKHCSLLGFSYIPLNVNVAFQVTHRSVRQPCRSALSRNLTNTLFASQWLECDMKLLTTSIELSEVFQRITWSRIVVDKSYIPGLCAYVLEFESFVTHKLWPAQCLWPHRTQSRKWHSADTVRISSLLFSNFQVPS